MTGTLTGRWELVGSLSCAGFAVRNLGMATVRGRLPIREAWVEVDVAGRPLALSATLDLAGIETGNARRDRDLAKPQLLDTARFPVLEFTGEAGEPDGDRWQLPGTLRGHGASTAVVLTATVSQASGDEVRVRATASFDRRDLGVDAPRILIGRRITVTIEAVLRPVR
jgi:polyisoprenoid-binding protein YceI